MLQPEILAALRAQLRHPDDGHRCCAVHALGSRATWEDLLPLIEDRNDNVYHAVFRELQNRGDDPRIWPHLLTLANDDSTPLRREIVEQARHHLPPEQARAWLLSRLECETDEGLRATIQRELEEA
jgi:HEAT repeat protein